MRILMLSRDASGLDPASQAAERWRLLRDQGVVLSICVSSRSRGGWEEAGIVVRGTGGRHMIQRLWRLWGMGKREAAGCDLITAQDPFELGWIALRFAYRFGRCVEVQDHGGFFDGQLADEPLWWIRKRLAHWIVQRVDSIRTVSPGSFSALETGRTRGKAYLLPIGVHDRFRGAVRRPESDHLVSVGRLVSVKRFDLLLNAVAELVRIRPSVRLTVVGDGPERQALERLTHELRLSEHVSFVGAADPLPYLERAAAFILLSQHEGWGVAAVEAALAQVPVMLSDTGCARWLEERAAATVVSSQDPKHIAQAIHARLEQDMLPSASLADVLSLSQTAKRQVVEWRQRCAKKLSILICAQAVDEDDALFGFFTSWLNECATYCRKLTVLALREGRHTLPAHVRIHRLRPVTSRSRLRVFSTLLIQSWKQRRDYTAVFVRGDAQYVVLAGWLWKLLGKRVVLWYAHYTSETLWLRLAAWWVDEILTSVPAACSLPQARPIGQGVDASRFSEIRAQSAGSPSLLIFGRVSPIKRVSWMLEQLAQTFPDALHRIRVVGRPLDSIEAERVRARTTQHGVVWQEQDILPRETPQLYQQFDILLNATPGSLDKTIVEAMLSGLVVVASSPGYRDALPSDLRWLAPHDQDFSATVQWVFALPHATRSELAARLNHVAHEHHSQTQQIKRVLEACTRATL